MDGWEEAKARGFLLIFFFGFRFCTLPCLLFRGWTITNSDFLACFAPIAQSGRICVLSLVSHV